MNVLVQRMFGNMKAISNPNAFPSKQDVKQMIEDNDGDVPESLLSKLNREATPAQLAFIVPKFSTALNDCLTDVYPLNKKGEVHPEFNQASESNRDKWDKYIRNVEQVCGSYAEVALGDAADGFTGKIITLLHWSKNSPHPPLPLMTEAAIISMQKLFAKSPEAIVVVSALFI